MSNVKKGIKKAIKKGVQMTNPTDDPDDDDDKNDDTTFISTCHSVRFDAPVSHICNCIYHVTTSGRFNNSSKQSTTRKKAINCLAIAGRDGFIRIFEIDAPFASLFAFPIRYERVLSLEFLPETSSFISVEHIADGSGNHVVIYEDWTKFPNLLKNVQVVEKGEDIIFNFVSSRGLPPNGYIAITSPGNMRLKSFQVQGINGSSSFIFDVKIRTVQISSDGSIIRSNTVVNSNSNDNDLRYITPVDINNDINFNDDINQSLLRISGDNNIGNNNIRQNRMRQDQITTLLVFELRTSSNIRLGPGAYRLSFPVAWKSRSRQRFRRELFAIELCDEYNNIIEAAQQLWIIDSDTANAAAHGYTIHPKYGGKINVCSENIRSLRKSIYIKQMKIFELGKTYKILNKKQFINNNNINNNLNNDNNNLDDDQFSSKSWFPSDFTSSSPSINNEGSVSSMSVCTKSGRIVTCTKSLISLWDCDLLLRTYRIPHDNYIENIVDKKNIKKKKTISSDIGLSRYRLGSTTSKNKKIKKNKKKIKQMITIRTPPLKILSIHASFIVKLLHLHNNYLAFASDIETRMVYIDINTYHHKNGVNDDIKDNDKKKVSKNTNKKLIDDYSSGDDDDDVIIVDIYKNSKNKKKNVKNQKKDINIMNQAINNNNLDINAAAQAIDLSTNSNSNSSVLGSAIPNPNSIKNINSNNKNKDDITSMRNVYVVFDENGCPSVQHHAASFMLIPSIYEFNRFVLSTSRNANANASSINRDIGTQYPFEMIGDFADHAHRVDLSTPIVDDNVSHYSKPHNSNAGKKLLGNIAVLNISNATQHKHNDDNKDKDDNTIVPQFDINSLDYNVIEKEILDRSQAMFDINQISMMFHRRFQSSVKIKSLQIIGNNCVNNVNKMCKKNKKNVRNAYRLLVATDDDVFVYDLINKKLLYSLHFTSLIICTYLHSNTFLFVLTEKDINIYSSEPTPSGELLLLWNHPLLRMRGLKILNNNKFCLEFGSQTEQNRFSVNADGRRIRLTPFDLRLRIQSPLDPDKRPLTIFEENSPKNILLFEWSQTSEMVLSLITKSHECMTLKIFNKSRHLLLISLQLIKKRKSDLYPLYISIKNQLKMDNIIPKKKKKNPVQNQKQQQNKKSLTSLISSAWNWMNTNQTINSMISVGNSSSLSSSTNAIPSSSIIQSEWQMLKQLKKECNGLLADVYVMENKYSCAAQHYILSNRQFIQIRQLYLNHIKKYKFKNKECDDNPINGLILFYRLFLEHKSRIDEELNTYSWNCIMDHFREYSYQSFSTIFLHPFMLNNKFNLNTAILWLNECININTTVDINNKRVSYFNWNNDQYSLICPSTITPINIDIIESTHYLAKVVLLCLKNDLDYAKNILLKIKSQQFILLLKSHKRLWLEWTHSKTFRRLCCITFPWEFARIILEYSISCYQSYANKLKVLRLSSVGINDDVDDDDDGSNDDDDNDDDDDDNSVLSHSIEELFPLRTLNFNESLEYFEYQTGGAALMQCYLEGAVRFLVEEIDNFEAIQIETNRGLPQSDHALYIKYLAELEEIGFTLIELYVQYLQKVCYDDTTNILMGNLNIVPVAVAVADDKKDVDNDDDIVADLSLTKKDISTTKQNRAIFSLQRHVWNSQYPNILRLIPTWLTQLLQKVQSDLFAPIKVNKVDGDNNQDDNKKQEEIDLRQNEQMIVMTRICTLLSCIQFGSSITKRERGAFLREYRDNKGINFKDKSKLLITSDKDGDDNKDKDKDDDDVIYNAEETVSLQWKRRLDLLLASCPDIPHKYINAITIIGYVGCGSISSAIHIVLEKEINIVTEFALSYCKSLSDWKILLDQILKLIRKYSNSSNSKEIKQYEFLEKSLKKIWNHLGRLSSLSTKQSEYISVIDLISLVPDDGNLEFFIPIFSNLCRNQAGDSLNMELFDRIVQVEKDKDYGFNQQMHEIFYPQNHQ